MRKQQPIKIAIYYPQTADRQLELSIRVAAVHADAVLARIKALRCSESQKRALLDEIIATARMNTARKSTFPDAIHK